MSTSAAPLSLSRFKLLADATPLELQKFAAAGHVRRFRPGEAIVRQGDFGSSIFFVLSGSVVARARRLDGTEITIALIGEGQSFGELGLAGDRPRAATVLGNEPCELLEVERDEFSRVFARNRPVIQRLDRSYRKAAIVANIYSSPLFSDLPKAAIDELIEKAKVQAYEKDDVIIEEGERGDALYLIWSGHVRVTRRDARGQERIFAYVAEGDYFGEMALVDARPRTATVIANDHVEVIRIGSEEFLRVVAPNAAAAAKLRSRVAERSAQGEQVLGSEARLQLIEGMITLGAAIASSALVINLASCTRCGACASACHELYGNSRLTRRGKTFVLPDTGESILMPNSCWHCKDPECMIGCPTDALRRGSSGEIQVLADRCIGCEICANRCPWGNITMADAPAPAAGSWLSRALRRLVGGRAPRLPAVAAAEAPAARGEKLDKEKTKAVKCDLCEGKAESACVMACPYGAIQRVDPNAFLRRAIEA